MDRLILNCDLGEDEPHSQTEQLLALVEAASIGCGVHAGNPQKTLRSIELAAARGILIGAHPGLPVAGGRGRALPTPNALLNLLETQIGSFQAAAQSLGCSAAYIKLHGSLYHAVEAQADLAKVYIKFLKAQPSDLAVFALAGGVFAHKAAAAGLRVYHEAFADRAYLSDGSLVPRSEKGAVLADVAALERFKQWREQGTMPTHCGQSISLKADTLCVHADSPDALKMIRELRKWL